MAFNSFFRWTLNISFGYMLGMAIYFIHCPALDAVKIGWSCNVTARARVLACNIPAPLVVLAELEASPALERALHHDVARHRIIGEWFDAHPDVFNLLERVKMGEAISQPKNKPKSKATGRGRGFRADPKNQIDRGAPAAVIAEKFGGLKLFSEAMGLAPSSVHRWLVRGTIDGKYHDAILAAAKGKSVRLKPADFVDTRPIEQRAQSALPVAAAL